MTEPRIIKGATVIGEVEPGSTFTRFRNLWVITHPDEPVKYLDLTDTAAGIKPDLQVPLRVTKLVEDNPKLEVKPLPVALQRLIDEVRGTEDNRATGYNRVYSRHNRS